jgi:hypothetical protein
VGCRQCRVCVGTQCLSGDVLFERDCQPACPRTSCVSLSAFCVFSSPQYLLPPLSYPFPHNFTHRRSMSVLNDMFGSMPTGFQQALHKYAEVREAGRGCRGKHTAAHSSTHRQAALVLLSASAWLTKALCPLLTVSSPSSSPLAPPPPPLHSPQAVFKLATDQSSGVRREVCIAFCNLVSVHPELLQAHLPQLIEYMLVSNQVSTGGLGSSLCCIFDSVTRMLTRRSAADAS